MQFWIYGAKAAIVMLFLLIAFRLLGKRAAAQMNIYDLAMIMAVSNGVQNAMTGGRGELPVGIWASTTVIILACLWSKFFVRSPKWEQRVVGHPTVILNHGVLLEDRMRKEGITDAEVMEALRQHGLDKPSQATLGVFEVDGSISIVPGESHKSRASKPKSSSRKSRRRA